MIVSGLRSPRRHEVRTSKLSRSPVTKGPHCHFKQVAAPATVLVGMNRMNVYKTPPPIESIGRLSDILELKEVIASGVAATY